MDLVAERHTEESSSQALLYMHAQPSNKLFYHLQDPSYAPFLGQLAKLVFLASSMHQLTVSVCSSLPYVIGQVGRKH